MMKPWLKKVESFLTFSHTDNHIAVHRKFSEVQLRQEKLIEGWGPDSTIQTLIYDFWSNDVLYHFLSILGAGVALTAIMSKRYPIKEEILIILIVGLISFLTFWVTIYRYQFKYKYLPALLAAKNAFLIREQIQKSAPQTVELITKCKQKQYKTTTLVLIFYTWTTLLGINPIRADKKISILLEKLYGTDQKALKKNFQDLVMARVIPKNGRLSTENEMRFQEAIGFFEQIGYEPGVQFLIHLERKLGNRPASKL